MDEDPIEEGEESLIDPTVISMLPPSISDDEKGQLFKELTTILSRKWTKDKTTVFGCSELDLLLATRFDVASLREALDEYRLFVKIIGLDLIEYDLTGERWYCLKSSYYAPSELQQSELVLLGLIMAMVEENDPKSITTEIIKKKLVISGKMKEYLVDLGLRNLVKMGYIQRKNNVWSYNYRTLIEYGDEERQKISEEFKTI
ncbi:MAG: hypothetical protein GOP50_06280 [Candidatus Heimdallarchaeota archaeon]|nr:hypothetical protein [Candidatus Heimdallarchaeota archaeon]